jgi:hypothetical protein
MASKASASHRVSVRSLAGLGEKSLGGEIVQTQRLRTSSQASFPRPTPETATTAARRCPPSPRTGAFMGNSFVILIPSESFRN